MTQPIRSFSVLPGFGLSLGISVLALSLLVALPLALLGFQAASGGWSGFYQAVADARVLAALRLSLSMAAVAVAVNGVFGTLTAWVLVRYQFVGKGLLNALVDLPFALPTAVTGIALATLYAPQGWVGRYLVSWGLKVAFTPAGIAVALVFVSLPFIVRSLQPVLEELSPEYEEAAATLGAGRLRIFFQVIVPELLPAWLAGAGLMFARATGEFGSVIFIAGNIPKVSEILPVLITGKIEQFDTTGAAAVAVLMLAVSAAVLLALNVLQWISLKRLGAKV